MRQRDSFIQIVSQRQWRRVILPMIVAATVSSAPAGALAIAVGDPVPDFFGDDQDGLTFVLSEQLGSVVLLHVCPMWCAPCVFSASKEAALAAEIDSQIGAESWRLVDVLYQDTDLEPTDQADAIRWRDKLHTPARTVHASGSAASSLYQFVVGLALDFVPTYLVVAPDGTVAAIEIGFFDPVTNQRLTSAVVEASPFTPDSQPPVISAKQDVVVEAQRVPVYVDYTEPTAVDTVDGPVPVFCDPASGGLFDRRPVSIECTARDQAGNRARLRFNVIVQQPTTPGAVTNPGNLDKPLTAISANRAVRVTAGGFAPGEAVKLSFVTPALESIELGETWAGSDGRIDVDLKIPHRAPRGLSQITVAGHDPGGAELIRAFLLTVEGGPSK